MKSVWRRRVAVAMAIVTSSALLATPPANAAGDTTVAWTHTHNYTTRLVSSNAGVTTGSCMSPYGLTFPAATTYAPNGDKVGSVAELDPNIQACDWQEPMLVDKSGNSFIAAGGVRGWNHVPQMYSFTKAGVARWAQPATLPQPCTGDDSSRYLVHRVIGADGNLYGIQLTYCDDWPKYHLVGFNGSDGTLRFVKELPFYDINLANLFAHRNGLTIYYNSGIRHFNYAGNWVSTVSYRKPLNNSLFPFPWYNARVGGSMAVGVGGNAVLITADTTNCSENGGGYYLKRIDSYRPWGFEWGADLNTCILKAIVQVTPDGGAVLFATTPNERSPLGYDTIIHRFNNNGNHERKRWMTLLPASLLGKQFHFEQDRFVGVDTNGNVLIERRYADQPSGGWNHFQIVKLADKNGALSVVADTGNSGKSGDFYDLAADVAMGNGQVYTAYGRSCHDGDVDCNTKPMLFAFKASGIGFDYPRWSVINAQPVKHTASFQALGDSFISGEGDDQQGFVVDRGRCHVSNTAWPMRISGDTRLNLMLTAFPACSGAKATQMVHGGDGQAKQVDKLQSGAKAYAVSAGGNDIGFSRLIASCILLDCKAVENEIMGKINNLSSQLNPLYDKIKQKSGTTGDVYVMGYPYVLPNSQCSVAPLGIEALSQVFINPAYKSAVTEWLAGIQVSADDYAAAIFARNFTFSSSEAEAAKKVTDALNAKIESVVKSRNDPKFHFVKANYSGGPFQGRTLCSDNPAFNGIVTTFSDPTALISNLALSLHPNNAGTAAYKQMFVDCWLSKKNCE